MVKHIAFGCNSRKSCQTYILNFLRVRFGSTTCSEGAQSQSVSIYNGIFLNPMNVSLFARSGRIEQLDELCYYT